VILSQGTNFQNVLNEAQKAVQADYCDSVVGHPEYVRQTSYVNALGAGTTVLSTTKNEDYPADPNLSRFCITKFHGFLATADPKLLDSSLISDIKIRLYMASDNVLTTSAGTGLGSAASGTGFETGFCAAGGTGGGKYVLTDIHATIEAIGLASNSYDEMIAAQMGQQGFLEIPMTRNSLQGARDAKNMSLDQYLNNYCVQVFRLNMPDSEYSRSISGLDTRSVNLQGIVRTEGTVGSSNLAISVFTESTSTLRVGAGRSIEVLS
jgi:hypothetical protein